MISIELLKTGSRAWVFEKELSELTGRSRSLLQKQRLNGTGIPFSRLESGRIVYLADDVLSHIERQPRHLATCEYDSNQKAAHLEQARFVKAERREKAARQTAVSTVNHPPV
jgi:hypothetical protein